MSITKGHLACVAVALASASLTALAACSSDDGEPSSGTSSTSSSSTSSSSGTSGTTSSGASGSTSSSSGDAAVPSDGGSSGASSGAVDAGKKALTEACTKADDCASNVCFMGNQGSYCSLACTQQNAATVCVAPFNGVCNNQGFCRKP